VLRIDSDVAPPVVVEAKGIRKPFVATLSKPIARPPDRPEFQNWYPGRDHLILALFILLPFERVQHLHTEVCLAEDDR